MEVFSDTTFTGMEEMKKEIEITKELTNERVAM